MSQVSLITESKCVQCAVFTLTSGQMDCEWHSVPTTHQQHHLFLFYNFSSLVFYWPKALHFAHNSGAVSQWQSSAGPIPVLMWSSLTHQAVRRCTVTPEAAGYIFTPLLTPAPRPSVAAHIWCSPTGLHNLCVFTCVWVLCPRCCVCVCVCIHVTHVSCLQIKRNSFRMYWRRWQSSFQGKQPPTCWSSQSLPVCWVQRCLVFSRRTLCTGRLTGWHSHW